MDRAIADAVLERASEHCEKCGRPGVELALHHRKRRSQGGEDSVANLIAVHPRCHDLIHSHQAWSYHRGWLVHREHDPALVPVFVDPRERPPKGLILNV